MVLSLKLSHKIGSISIVVIAGIAAIAGIYVYGASVQDRYQSRADAANAIVILADRLHVDLLESRRSEKDFLLRNDVKYAERHFSLKKKIVEDLDSLQRQGRALGLDALAQDANAIASSFEAYSGNFGALVKSKTRLGLNENAGLEGALRNSVHAIEKTLDGIEEPKYLVTMLMMRRHEKDFMLRRNPKYGDDMKKRAAEMTAAIGTSDLREVAKETVNKNLIAYQRDFFAWMNGAMTVAEDIKAMSAAYAKGEPHIDAIVGRAEAARQDMNEQNRNSRASVKNQMLVAMLLIALTVSSLCFLIARGIVRPIRVLTGVMQKIAEGDFTVTLPGIGRKDEIGQINTAVRLMIEKVSETIHRVKASAREVTNASAEIATSTTDLSQRTEEQAASLEETSASMEQMTATVSKNADNAQQANQLAAGTLSVADRGGKVVAETVAAMARIEDSSRKIADIISVIDEIARQTNLLALNAAVEAARAGEAGRGFAVVASEVRSLAQRSAQAAKDINALISGSTGQVQEGVDLVGRVGNALHDIVESIKQVGAVVAEIANASSEQSSGIEQINKALSQMDEATQRNSALVEENAATAKALEHQAKSMDTQVAFFDIGNVSHDRRPAQTGGSRRQAASEPDDEAEAA